MEKPNNPMLNSPILGYAHHRIILDDAGNPMDYKFLEVNDTFEKMTGLKAKNLVGNNVKKVIPGIEKEKFDWIKYYGDVALGGEEKVFKQYSESLETWYRVHVYSIEKLTFTTMFINSNESENKLEDLELFFSLNLDLLCIADLEGNFIKTNKAWCKTLGYSTEELNERKFLEFVHRDDMQKTLEAIDHLTKGKDVLQFINRYRCKDGSYRFIEWHSHPKDNLIYATARDITEKKEAKEKMARSEERYTRAISGTGAGLWDWDMVNNTVYFSPQWKKMLGYEDHEIPNDFSGWRKLWHPDEVDFIEQAVKNYLDGQSAVYEVENRLLHKDGNWHWILTRGEMERDLSGKPIRWTGTNIDITDRKVAEEALKQSEARYKIENIAVKKKNEQLSRLNAKFEEVNKKLEYLSQKDTLTTLYNRRYFNEKLKEYLSLATRTNTDLSVIMIDMDDFKIINDTFGHLEGDKVLKAVARIIKSSLRRDTDFAARFGGDEFIMILYDTDKKGAEIVAGVIIEKIEALNKEPEMKEKGIKLSVSIGVTQKEQEEYHGEKLLIRVDQALYAAKEEGRERSVVK